MSTRRKTDPIFLQYIWDALDACFNLSLPPNLDNIFNYLVKEKDQKATLDKVQLELSNCLEDGCITLLHNKEYIKQQIQPVQVLDHDWYCNECHGPNCDFHCDLCYRSYHMECLEKADESITSNLIFSKTTPMPKFTRETMNCPICVRVKYFDDYSCLETDLRAILLSALNNTKNKNSWKLLGHIGYVNDPNRNAYLLAKEINTKIIGRKMRLDKGDSQTGSCGPLKCYRNRNELLLDLDHLVHNTAVIYGLKNDMCQSARQIRCLLRREMRESSLCIDCYINDTKADKSIVTPCRNDHKIIWYQHNGWSFWPCKVLHENQDGYEVVKFGGRHERNFVPKDRGHDFFFSATEMGLRITPALKKALLEVDEYQANKRLEQHISRSGLSSYQTESSLKRETNNKRKLEKTMSLQPSHLSSKQPKNSEPSRSKGKEIPRRSSEKHLSKSYLSETDDSLSGSSSASEESAEEKEAENVSTPLPTATKVPVLVVRTRDRSSSLSSLTMSEDDEKEEPVSRKVQIKSPVTKVAKKPGLVLRIKPIPPPRTNDEEAESLSSYSSRFTSSHSPLAKLDEGSCSNSSGTLPGASNIPNLPVQNEDEEPYTSRPIHQTDGKNKKQHKIPISNGLPNPDHNRLPVSSNSASKVKRKSEIKNTSDRKKNKAKRRSEPQTAIQKSNPTPSNENNERQTNSRKQSSRKEKRHKIYSSDDEDSGSESSGLSPNSRQRNKPHRFSSDSSLQLGGTKQLLDTGGPSNDPMTTPTNDSPDKHMLIMPSPDKLLLTRKPNHSDYSSLSGSATPITSLDGRPFSQKSNSPEKWSNPNFQSTNQAHPSASTYGLTNLPASSSSSSLNHIHQHGHPHSHHQTTANSVSPAALSSSSSSGLGSCCLSDVNTKSVDASPGEGYRSSRFSSNGNPIPSHKPNGSTNESQLDPAFIKAIEDRVTLVFQERLNSLSLEREMLRERNATLEKELTSVRKHHEDELKHVKRKCWCIVCLSEANYHCCAAISYCSQACQFQHWKSDHSKVCKRVNHS